jgi:hypothetical protein
MNSYNDTTRGVPIEQIQSISGLVLVLHFVDIILNKVDINDFDGDFKVIFMSPDHL